MKWLRFIWGDWWEVRKCYWPYPEGYATYNRRRKTVLDTGLSKQDAQLICDNLNNRK